MGPDMSDYFDGTEDAKTAIRAAVQYLLKRVPAATAAILFGRSLKL